MIYSVYLLFSRSGGKNIDRTPSKVLWPPPPWYMLMVRRGLGLGYRYCKCRALEILFQYLSDLVLKVLFKCPGSKNFCTEKFEEIRNNFPLIAGSRFVFY